MFPFKGAAPDSAAPDAAAPGFDGATQVREGRVDDQGGQDRPTRPQDDGFSFPPPCEAKADWTCDDNIPQEPTTCSLICDGPPLHIFTCVEGAGCACDVDGLDFNICGSAPKGSALKCEICWAALSDKCCLAR